MPFSTLGESHGFWTFLGLALGVLGTFALGILKAVTGKEVSFRQDLIKQIEGLMKQITEQRDYFETRLEEQRVFYETRLEEQRARHRADIADIRAEYTDHGASK